VLRLDELDEAETLPLEDLALRLRDQPVDLAARALGRVGGAAAAGSAAPGARRARISSRVSPA
jgi:hypothetical protein